MSKRHNNSIEHDDVNHPRWYTDVPFTCACGKTVEPLTISQHLSFSLGSVIKYCVRAGVKHEADNGVQDLEKARYYIDTEIKLRKRQLKERDNG